MVSRQSECQDGDFSDIRESPTAQPQAINLFDNMADEGCNLSRQQRFRVMFDMFFPTECRRPLTELLEDARLHVFMGRLLAVARKQNIDRAKLLGGEEQASVRAMYNEHARSIMQTALDVYQADQGSTGQTDGHTEDDMISSGLMYLGSLKRSFDHKLDREVAYMAFGEKALEY